MSSSNSRRVICVVSLIMVLMLSFASLSTRTISAANMLTGETERNVSEIYHGVTLTSLVLDASSSYGIQRVNILEFDPKQSDLYIDVTNTREYSNQLCSVQNTIDNFNKLDNGKTAIAAVNGDMWMVTYAHARVLGSGTTYGGQSDPVVTKSLTIPRGFNVYNGEIISSPHISQETPYEGDFTSFGWLSDNTVVFGKPKVTIAITNTTKGSTSVKADGLNRLPAKNALVMYSDKGPLANYALDDAYEVIIDCDYDYVIKHGETIKGKVTAICKEGDEDQAMKANRIILTARGSTKISKISDMSVGDEIEIAISVTDNYSTGRTKAEREESTLNWQQVQNAVGGHMEFCVNGKSINIGTGTGYPSTIIAETNEGKMMLIVNDGRQTGFSVGIPFAKYSLLAKELDFKNAFIVDGGGSATLVALDEAGYKLINRPSDKKENGEYGQARTVVNSIILSYGTDRNATPTPIVTPSPEATLEITPGSEISEKSSDNTTKYAIVIIGAAVLLVALIITIAIYFSKKK